ncbi:hypothetical protein H4S07_002768 [Coemansia furcata]|uniref:Uncharacterized protein n=1 Tax=Coemansia furcata TaxID=417177 RepID=A0ACC1LJ66_9FUNG|nr:hypothetical protein H4S07_002768 [Coemansia furcata]
MSTPPNPSEMAGMPNPPSAPAVIAESTYVAYEGIHITYKPDDVDFTNVQRCLEDKRIRLVTVNSATFSGELQLEKEPYQKFLVMEKNHFTLFSCYGPPVKFSYKSRNAVMSLLWRSIWLSDMSITQFVEVDGLWQLEQLPVLYFVFGRDADTMHSNYLIDDNTISEHYESTATMDMTELTAVAQSKTDLCVSHFFVVNRGKEYWAVDTKDPNVSYTFGSSTKTRTISRLANGSMTVQVLIDEEQSHTSVEAQASQDRGFKLCDINGEEVSEGEEFVLHIRSDRDEDDDPTNESDNMYDGKDWLDVFDHTGDGKAVTSE